MKTITMLLLNSLTIDVTSYLISSDSTGCENTNNVDAVLQPIKYSWKNRFAVFTNKFTEWNSFYSNQWLNQFPKDINADLNARINPRWSNQETAMAISELLNAKYPWRRWMIAVTSSLPINRQVAIEICDGYMRLNVHQKHVFVSSDSLSSDVNSKRVAASKLLRSIEGTVFLSNSFPNKASTVNGVIGASCQQFQMFGSASSDSGLVIIGSHELMKTTISINRTYKEAFTGFIMV